MPDIGLVEKELARLQAWIIAGLSFMFVAAVLFILLAVWITGNAAGKVAKAKHESDQALACYIQPQMDRAEASLPTIEYYKRHPKELSKQLAVIREQRELALDAWGRCESL